MSNQRPAAIERPESARDVALVVGVEGSLAGGGSLIEGVSRAFSADPRRMLALPFSLAGGRPALKRRVAVLAPPTPESLVLNPSVLKEIATAQSQGRQVWLASGLDAQMVASLAARIGVDGHFGSEGGVHLVGQAKADALVRQFGQGGFDYIGGDRCDLASWQCARQAICVDPSASLARVVRGIDEDARILAGPDGSPLDYLRALRPHQWIKNTLVFAPLAASHATEASLYLAAAGLFVALSACASWGYVLNDLLDLPHDRQHEVKRKRPIASGAVPLGPMLGIATLLAILGLALAGWLSLAAAGHVALYMAVTAVYSLWLKGSPVIDAIALAMLYTIRVLAGAAVAAIIVSPWLLSFCIFTFLALAMVKRIGEYRSLGASGSAAFSGRAYQAEDLPPMIAICAASSFASAFVFTLYIHSADVVALYSHPEYLWFVCPLLIYVLARMLLLANRGAFDDPVAFAMRDASGWLAGLGALAVLAAAL